MITSTKEGNIMYKTVTTRRKVVKRKGYFIS